MLKQLSFTVNFLTKKKLLKNVELKLQKPWLWANPDDIEKNINPKSIEVS